MRFAFSRHALEEMQRRAIPRHVVESVLDGPQQVTAEYGGRKAYQSQVALEGGKTYLVRVIVDDRADPAVVMTVYRTTKIGKYWREP